MLENTPTNKAKDDNGSMGLYCEIKEPLKVHSHANGAQKLRMILGQESKITHSGAGLRMLEDSEAPPAHGRALSIGRFTEVPRSRWFSSGKGPGLRAASPAGRRSQV